MNTFLISYDLGSPESHLDYAALSAYIKEQFPLWARPVQSVWIIKSDLNTSEIRNRLKGKIDSNDKLIVVKMGKGWASYNISKEVTDWMHKNA